MMKLVRLLRADAGVAALVVVIVKSIKKCGAAEATNLLTTAGGVPTHTVESNYHTLFDALHNCGWTKKQREDVLAYQSVPQSK